MSTTRKSARIVQEDTAITEVMMQIDVPMEADQGKKKKKKKKMEKKDGAAQEDGR